LSKNVSIIIIEPISIRYSKIPIKSIDLAVALFAVIKLVAFSRINNLNITYALVKRRESVKIVNINSSLKSFAGAYD
jgi:hypothetical protein